MKTAKTTKPALRAAQVRDLDRAGDDRRALTRKQIAEVRSAIKLG